MTVRMLEQCCSRPACKMMHALKCATGSLLQQAVCHAGCVARAAGCQILLDFIVCVTDDHKWGLEGYITGRPAVTTCGPACLRCVHMVGRKSRDCLQWHPMTQPCHAAVQPWSLVGTVAGGPARAHIDRYLVQSWCTHAWVHIACHGGFVVLVVCCRQGVYRGCCDMLSV
jgi:hypothetical protein